MKTAHQAHITAIIPARLHSTRLPRKLLLDLGGKAVLHHVYDRLVAADFFDAVIIAVDHVELMEYCDQHNLQAVMTDTTHISGTDRVAEVASTLETDYIINVQGDEPFVNIDSLKILIKKLMIHDVQIATLCHKISDSVTLFDYNAVKVVKSESDEALYFSRQAIPSVRNKPFKEWLDHADYYKHMGIYGFKKDTLHELSKLKPTKLEKVESLEQLRWLSNGYKVYVAEATEPAIGIDTQEDLDKARKLFPKV